MRRGGWAALTVLALLAVAMGPEGAGAARDAGITERSGMAEVAAPPWHRWEASTRMTRGGFVDFGARLNARAANGSVSCRTATFPQNTYRSCSWESLDIGTGESFLPPIGNGRITQVRIKTGPSTGSVRVVVLRAYRQASNNAYICCVARSTTNTLNLRPNRVNVFNVNLPVTQSRAPNGNGLYIDDHLALSMLGGTTVIPANIDNTGTSLSGWYPRWQVGQQRTGPYGTSGAMVLMRLRWRPR